MGVSRVGAAQLCWCKPWALVLGGGCWCRACEASGPELGAPQQQLLAPAWHQAAPAWQQHQFLAASAAGARIGAPTLLPDTDLR